MLVRPCMMSMVCNSVCFRDRATILSGPEIGQEEGHYTRVATANSRSRSTISRAQRHADRARANSGLGRLAALAVVWTVVRAVGTARRKRGSVVGMAEQHSPTYRRRSSRHTRDGHLGSDDSSPAISDAPQTARRTINPSPLALAIPPISSCADPWFGPRPE